MARWRVPNPDERDSGPRGDFELTGEFGGAGFPRIDIGAWVLTGPTRARSRGKRAGAVLVASACSLPGLASAQEAPATDASSASSSSALPPTSSTAQGDRTADKPADEDKKKESARIFELVWANVEGGFSYINMQQFSSSNLGLANSSSAGGMFGFGAGIRLFILTLGLRARLNDLSAFTFWELNGELGFHIPAGHWDPYFNLHGGYAFSGSLGEVVSSTTTSVDTRGGDAGLSIGADYYFLKVLSLGLDVTGDGLFLSRPPAQIPAGVPASVAASLMNQPLYKATGDSVGFGISGSLHFGLHL
jgi:hypothetical protein